MDSPAQSARPPRKSGEDSLKSLNKVAKILDCFDLNRRSLSLAEICEITGFPRSTTHRLAASMREVGFLEQEHERDAYRLGLRLFELGSTVLANLELHREGSAIVNALHQLTNRTVHLAVFDGQRAVVIQRTESGKDGMTPSSFVENSPAYCTSVGKAILAHQDEETVDRVIALGLKPLTDTTLTDPDALRADLAATRERGYSLDDGEHQPSLRCVGAPIRNASGRVFAAISVSAPVWELGSTRIEDFSQVVTYHANLISQRLGYNR
ncbi:IclR family transcriptional regulator [Psychromarinibacter halotolerans]|uniref:IclR family transcriptional regulator n=1 Tax=Psychromarinibacter halotolerans TaxID=1775175 RepID=A0ABV7GZW9_9RHOB|nr:IclR family transcriptional regulator [Psychromarinibacter halotolerans]MDF0596258.1 IclR family transcriptional regulator [Psychromarinibacter halotolerans]